MAEASVTLAQQQLLGRFFHETPDLRAEQPGDQGHKRQDEPRRDLLLAVALAAAFTTALQPARHGGLAPAGPRTPPTRARPDARSEEPEAPPSSLNQRDLGHGPDWWPAATRTALGRLGDLATRRRRALAAHPFLG